jgi:heme-degrading monooxygenase HmoA
MPIRATLHMRVRDGAGPEFEQAWHRAADAFRYVPGNLGQELLRDGIDYVLTSDWDSAESFRRFETSAEQDRLTAPLRSLRTSAHMEVHEIVHRVDRSAP